MTQEIKTERGLRGGSIGVLHIVFFVIATAGPLARWYRWSERLQRQ